MQVFKKNVPFSGLFFINRSLRPIEPIGPTPRREIAETAEVMMIIDECRKLCTKYQ
jgi:hypothetical protein